MNFRNSNKIYVECQKYENIFKFPKMLPPAPPYPSMSINFKSREMNKKEPHELKIGTH